MIERRVSQASSATGEEYDNNMLEADTLLVKNCFMLLLQSESVCEEEKIKIIELLQYAPVRFASASFFYEINSPRHVEKYEALVTLGEFTKHLLSASVNDKDTDFKIVYAILLASQHIYAKKDKRKEYLTSIVKDHGIWTEASNWKQWMERIIESKIKENARFSKKGGGAPERSSIGGGLLNMFGIKKYIMGAEEPPLQSQASLNQIKNVVFNILSNFIFYFSNFAVSFCTAKRLLLHFCD